MGSAQLTEPASTKIPRSESERESARAIAPRRTLFALPGLHRVNRGAEVAFESIARNMATVCEWPVSLIGSGRDREEEPYSYSGAGCVSRERFERMPSIPVLRGPTCYEELTWLPGLLRRYNPSHFEATLTCSFPFTNWVLTRRKIGGRRPAHIFVTQNGDWPAISNKSEFRKFDCDGLVCTNPDYFDRAGVLWPSRLIPNGVDPSIFCPAEADRGVFGLPQDRPVALMVSALIESKRVADGVRAAAKVSDLHLVVAGDGPERATVDALGTELMPGRFSRVELPRLQMPDLYRCADVFLHMSKTEPSANAYMEALATGLPIVTHDRRVTKWTLESCGSLLDTEDLEAVAGAIRDALDSDSSRKIEERLGLINRRFAWAQIAREYCEFIDTVIREREASA